MKKISVCLATEQLSYSHSGVGTYVSTLLDHFKNFDISLTIICPENEVDNSYSNFEIITYKPSIFDPSHQKWISSSKHFNKILNKIKTKFDLIHFSDAREAYFYDKDTTPVIGTHHDYLFSEASINPFFYKKNYTDWIERYFYYNIGNLLEKRAIRKLDGVITNTEYVKKKIVKHYKIDEKKVSVIYLGLPQINDKKILENKKCLPKIIFIGGNYQGKGLPTVLKACANLHENFPDLKLKIFGKDRNQNKMESLAEKLGVKDHVIFNGWKDRNDVYKELENSSILTRISVIDAFGLVFLEAMQRGVAVVGSTVGGIPELIKDNKNGFCVNPGDADDLTNKIKKLLTDKAMYEKIISNGFDTGCKFSSERMAKETYEYYLKIYNLL